CRIKSSNQRPCDRREVSCSREGICRHCLNLGNRGFFAKARTTVQWYRLCLKLIMGPSARQPTFVVASREMLRIRELARRAGRPGAKPLIPGETGVGKDLVAREIHAASDRARREFLAVNCAGIAEELLESELFGHIKGSFTSAYCDRLGKLQLADGGTLF